MSRSILYIADILEWAKEFHKCHGRWPVQKDGRVTGKDFTWTAVDTALRKGCRGLPGGSSLRRLLRNRCGHRRKGRLPDLTIRQILAWADSHFKRTKKWPHSNDKIYDAPGETWLSVHTALRDGRRGLRGGTSLAQLLWEQREVRNIHGLTALSEEQILAWADAFQFESGTWPTKKSDPIVLPAGETWRYIDTALRDGARGLTNGQSLLQLLARHRGVRNRKALPNLQVQNILAWADAHYERSGRWPTHLSGPVPEAPGETWSGVHAALYSGIRGLPGGDSLSKLLKRHGRRSKRIQSRH